jgi:hypothetical protein
MLRSVAGFFSQPTNDGKKAMLAPLHNRTIVAFFFFFFAQLMKKKAMAGDIPQCSFFYGFQMLRVCVAGFLFGIFFNKGDR